MGNKRYKTCSGCKQQVGVGYLRCSCGQWHFWESWYEVAAEIPFEKIKPYLSDRLDIYSDSTGKNNSIFRLNYNGASYKVRGKGRHCVFKHTPYCIVCNATITKCLLIKNLKKPHKAYQVIYLTDNYMRMTLDHVTPKSRGGKNEIKNYVSMCEECNNFKDDMTLEEFLRDRIAIR